MDQSISRSFRRTGRTLVGACVGGIVGIGAGAFFSFVSMNPVLLGAFEGGIAGAVAGAAEVNFEAEIDYSSRFVMDQGVEDGLIFRSAILGSAVGFTHLYFRIPQLIHDIGEFTFLSPFSSVAGSIFGSLVVQGLNVNSFPMLRDPKVQSTKAPALV